LAHPDLKLVVDMKDIGEADMGMASLTGATFYIFPSKAVDNYVLKATLTDMKSGKVSNINLEDNVTQWQEILLLPLLPFKSTIMAIIQCQNNIFDNLAVEIQKTGALE
jgi:hypothetical protein